MRFQQGQYVWVMEKGTDTLSAYLLPVPGIRIALVILMPVACPSRKH